MRDARRLDPVERLIDAWLHWCDCPTSRPAVVEIHDAIAALGLPANTVYERVGAARRAGYDVPSAVQRVVQDLRQEAV